VHSLVPLQPLQPRQPRLSISATRRDATRRDATRTRSEPEFEILLHLFFVLPDVKAVPSVQLTRVSSWPSPNSEFGWRTY